MYTVEVVVARHNPDSQYIGRSSNPRQDSPLGNPFPISQTATRDMVCDQYEIWFQDQIHHNNRAVINEVLRLHGIGKTYGYVKLGCFCSPKRCHGLTIKRFLENNYDYLDILEDNNANR